MFRFRKSSFALASIALLGLTAFQPAMAQHYTVTDLGTLGGQTSTAFAINREGEVAGGAEISPGSFSPRPFFWSHEEGLVNAGSFGNNGTGFALNNRGQVAGGADLFDGGFHFHAFISTKGTVQDLGTFGGRNSTAFGINNEGEAVGSADLAGGGFHAFLWSEGALTDIGTLGGTNSNANAITNEGQVVGGADLAGGGFHPFLWEEGVMRDIGSLGGSGTAFGINRHADVVGGTDTSPFFYSTHAFLWSEDAGMRDLGTLGGYASTAYGVNNHKQVVGVSDINGWPNTNAFLWQHGKLSNLNDLVPANSGWKLLGARGINDRGQIAGYGLIFDTKANYWVQHAFLLSPTDTDKK